MKNLQEILWLLGHPMAKLQGDIAQYQLGEALCPPDDGSDPCSYCEEDCEFCPLESEELCRF